MQTSLATSSLDQRFGAALDRAAAVAAHSPSSHNSQPWAHLTLTGGPARRAAARLLEGRAHTAGPDPEPDPDTAALVLALDHGRTLTSLPAHATEMRLSCGMYGQLLLRALAAQGWTTESVALAEEDGAGTAPHWDALRCPTGLQPLAVVALRRTGPAQGDGALASLADAVRRRRTNRGPYLDTPVDRKVLAELAAPADLLAAGAGVSVRHLRAPEERRRFAALVAAHASRDFSHRAAWAETYSYIREDDADARAHGDGFTLEQLFGPMAWPRRRAMRLALSPAAMRSLGHLGYDRFLAGQLAALTRHSPVITAVGLPGGEPGGARLLRAGAWLADYWLRATDADLALHPVSVLLQHDDTRRDVQRELGLPGRTVFVSRLGYPAAAFAAPPRRTVAAYSL